MLTSWYFIWFAFRVVALTAHATFFSDGVQPFVVVLKPSWWDLSSDGVVSMVEQRWVSNGLFFLLPPSMILTTYFFIVNCCPKKLSFIVNVFFFYHIIKLSKLIGPNQVNDRGLWFSCFFKNNCITLTSFFSLWIFSSRLCIVVVFFIHVI